LFIIGGCNPADIYSSAFLLSCGSGSSLNQSRSHAQQTFHEIEFRMLLTQPTEGIQFCQFDFSSSFFLIFNLRSFLFLWGQDFNLFKVSAVTLTFI